MTTNDENREARIERLAIKMAQRDDVDFSKLTDYMKHAYRHNVEILINTADEAVQAAEEAKQALVAATEAAKAAQVEEPKTVDIKDADMSDPSAAEIARAEAAAREAMLAAEAAADQFAATKPPTPKAHQYFCSKCQRIHNRSEKPGSIGLKHAKNELSTVA